MKTQPFNAQTSGQVGPKINIVKDTGMPVIINGCAVSFSSSPKGADEAIKTVKEILLSAYRTRIARC